MKYIAACLLVFVTNAFGDEWVSSNTDGGRIVVTDQVCTRVIYGVQPDPRLREAYATTSGGRVTYGCGVPTKDGQMIVIWDFGRYIPGETPERVYRLDNFKRLK